MAMLGIDVDDDILTVAHHPTLPQVAVGLVTGDVRCYSYDATALAASAEDDAFGTGGRDGAQGAEKGTKAKLEVLWQTKRHRRAARALAYSPDGQWLVSAGADRCIKRCHAHSGKVVQKMQPAKLDAAASAGDAAGGASKSKKDKDKARQKIKGAAEAKDYMHKDSINCVAWINSEVFATGDDAGQLRAWRTDGGGARPFRAFDDAHDDYVSRVMGIDGKFLLSVSGDGSLAVHDLRVPQDLDPDRATTAAGIDTSAGAKGVPKKRNAKSALVKRSDDQEDELLCVAGPFKRRPGLGFGHGHSASNGASAESALQKREKYLVGGAEGVVSIFGAGDWGDSTDRILPPRHLASIGEDGALATTSADAGSGAGRPLTKKRKRKMMEEVVSAECIALVDPDRCVVGGGDGKVRLLNVLPNRYLGVVADLSRAGAGASINAGAGAGAGGGGELDAEPIADLCIARLDEQQPVVWVACGTRLRAFAVPDEVASTGRAAASDSSEDDSDQDADSDEDDEDDQDDERAEAAEAVAGSEAENNNSDDDGDGDDDEDASDDAEASAEGADAAMTASNPAADAAAEADEEGQDDSDSDDGGDAKARRRERQREKQRERKQLKRELAAKAAGHVRNDFFDDL